MADKKVKATVQHRMIKWNDESGHHVASRGETVELPESEFKRLDAHGAFVTEGDEPDLNGKLSELSTEATDEEVVAWVKSAKVGEVTDYLSANPSMASRILDAEVQASDGQPRSGVVKAAEAAAGTTQ